VRASIDTVPGPARPPEGPAQAVRYCEPVGTAETPSMKSRARALYFAIILSLLAMVQVRAQVEQLLSGYRPLSHPPGRVPYSWDMFAIRLDRCVVGWDPPLEVDGERVARWHDRLPALEFDTVFNDADWYVEAATRGCEYRTHVATIAYLTCFSSDGRADERSFDCP
jgi:hypothetical protein